MNISTSYMGLNLKNPLIGSSSPLWTSMDNIKRFEDSGGAALVLHSLFEEQIEISAHCSQSTVTNGEAEYLTYLPDFGLYGFGADHYLSHLQKAKSAVAIPVIASINGVTTGGWVECAKEVQRCGADALELNIYDIAEDLSVPCAAVENRLFDLIREVRRSVTLPLAVKIDCFFSSIPNVVARIEECGVDAVVLFNRLYQPDIDLRTFEFLPRIRLSTSGELGVRLHWLGVLREKVKIDMAVTGGVHSSEDVVKCIVAGADGVMMTSAILRRGTGYVTEVIAGLERWLEYHGYSSFGQLKGILPTISSQHLKSQQRINYLRVLGSFVEY